MKKPKVYKMILPILCGVLCLAVVHDSEAQKKKKKSKSKRDDGGKIDKAEVKKWKRKLKSLDPLQYKQMSEEYDLLKGENSNLKRQTSVLERQTSDAEEALSDAESELRNMTKKYNDLKKNYEDGTKIATTAVDDYTKGIVYRVQIGAFRNPKLKSLQTTGQFWVEDGDGTKKYTIANFRDYWEANTFKKYMRKMGVKDAWIVAYEDDQRKNIKEVLKKK